MGEKLGVKKKDNKCFFSNGFWNGFFFFVVKMVNEVYYNGNVFKDNDVSLFF